jgi:hypothetical protein
MATEYTTMAFPKASTAHHNMHPVPSENACTDNKECAAIPIEEYVQDDASTTTLYHLEAVITDDGTFEERLECLFGEDGGMGGGGGSGGGSSSSSSSSSSCADEGARNEWKPLTNVNDDDFNSRDNETNNDGGGKRRAQ